MADIDCPYCNAPQEVNHDDGQGYAEDKIHEQQCDSCDKIFTFTTSIQYYYETNKAACLHQWESTFTHPVRHTKMECKNCGGQRSPTEYEMVLILNKRSR